MRRVTMRSCWRARFVASAAILIATSAAWVGSRPNKAAMISELVRAGKLTAQLENVRSHNRRYRASLLPSRGAGWNLQLEKFDGETISGASLVMQAWMPESANVSPYQPRVIAEGRGTYRVEGLRFEKSGWWNVKLGISQAGLKDSLAFNLIVP